MVVSKDLVKEANSPDRLDRPDGARQWMSHLPIEQSDRIPDSMAQNISAVGSVIWIDESIDTLTGK